MEKRKDSKGRILRNGELQKEDGRYEYRYIENGVRKSFYSWKLTEADAVPAGKRPCISLREMEDQLVMDRVYGLKSQQKATVNDRWDEYIANKPELKQSTRTNYRYMYDKYVRDDVGRLKMKDVTFSVMKRFFNKLLHERGFKPNSVEIISTILHPVFTIAVRDGLVRLNPLDGIMADLKRSNDWEKPKRHALTVEQQKAFMDFVREHDVFGHWYPLFVCLLGTGCRIGEMLGLRWADIDWQESVISINHSLIYRLQDDGSVQLHVTTPKTKNSVREIPMLKNVKDALRSEYVRQGNEGFCEMEIDGYSGFIWQSREGGAQTPHNINRAIKRVIAHYNAEERERAKREKRKPELLPDFSCHNLRHTFCTRYCENETDLKAIQEIMGHANIQTTMDIYNESNMKRKKASFARLEAIAEAF